MDIYERPYLELRREVEDKIMREQQMEPDEDKRAHSD